MKQIAKWFNKLFSFINQPNETSFEEKSLLVQCQILLNNFDSDKFKQYRHRHGIGIGVGSFYDSIDEYTEVLTIQTKSIEATDIVIPNLCMWKIKPISINHFFSTKNKLHQNVYLATLSFIKAALDLCNILSLTNINTAGATEYNIRLLTPLLINIKEIILTLAEIQTI